MSKKQQPRVIKKVAVDPTVHSMPPPLPVEIWHVIFELILHPALSLFDTWALVQRTKLVNTLRLVSRTWACMIDGRKSFFRFCFWNLSLPQDSGDNEARDVVDALTRWCLKADRLTLVLRLSASTSQRAHACLASLLHRVCSTIEAIRIYAPDPNDPKRGACIF